MKPIVLTVAALVLLGACSKRDICLNNASRELRTITELTEETRANVTRGYALGEREKVRERKYRCDVDQPDGSVMTQICTEMDTYTESFPVAIDLNAERAKLRSLQARRAQVARATEAARAECRARYPD